EGSITGARGAGQGRVAGPPSARYTGRWTAPAFPPRREDCFMDRYCSLFLVGLLAGTAAAQAPAEDRDPLPVGVPPDEPSGAPTTQLLKPAGQQVTFPGRPVARALLDGGKTMAVVNMKGLVFLDAATGTVRQTLAAPVGLSVVGLAAHGDRLFVSDAKD